MTTPKNIPADYGGGDAETAQIVNTLLESWQAKMEAPFAVLAVRTIGERLVRIEYLPRRAAPLKPQTAFAREVCRQLKGNPSTEPIPIVMLTARSAEDDRVRGFELGAEDYVSKPFSVRELLLRLEVVRRHTQAVERKDGVGGRILRAGEIELEPESFVVRVGGRPVTLALLEFRLLQFLIEGEGKVRTREELLRRVWDYPLDSDTRTIETHVKRLRRKLGDAGERIETVRSVGYRIRIAD